MTTKQYKIKIRFKKYYLLKLTFTNIQYYTVNKRISNKTHTIITK